MGKTSGVAPLEERISLYERLRRLLPAYAQLFGFSFFTNILVLVPSIYLMQVGERVFTSKSYETLLFLTAIAVFLMIVMSILHWLRGESLKRIALNLDEQLRGKVFAAVHRFGRRSVDGPRYFNDLDAVRDALSGPFIPALFDTLLSPIFLIVLFIIHPVFGFLGLTVTLLLGGLSAMNLMIVERPNKNAREAQAKALEFAVATNRNVETARSMGMVAGLGERWINFHGRAAGWQTLAQQRSAGITGLIRFIRMSQMILIIGVGALLYLDDAVSQGATYASMLIMMRGLGPVEALVGQWRSVSNARAAVQRLNKLLAEADQFQTSLSLPRPAGHLTASGVVVGTPGKKGTLVRDVSFSLQAGRILAIIGDSGAGKSCLLRTLAGIWSPTGGTVALDGHSLTHWDPGELGRYVGYVPQDVDMLPGTVAENISRFYPASAENEALLFEAAELAGVTDLIQSLPNGFNTILGPNGHVLSGGQRQRIALARAVYGRPVIVFLDEPNSALDARGEALLIAAVQRLKAQGTTVILVTHKMNMLPYCDDVLVMHSGALQAYGQREEILQRLPHQKPTPLKVIEGHRGS
ncbi:type I secretion system permease/ATPase [Aurantimonas sp. VKM B-3413]|uniref:type I secretion system permease/ATPase n=1 Tax=Aurantimonas sp. VKM B-3413 TaxID=2779401 RepID=UPI001E471ADA|nr:type I secretion system permease/ATPase [Aurantimonas sp. VKM B-3413]MCB8836489.1 type I secretion system permease/ATPase [Aurantimonas sp. VKM B-3413]